MHSGARPSGPGAVTAVLRAAPFAFALARLRKAGSELVYRCANQHSEPTSDKRGDKRGIKADELHLTPLELIERIAALVPPPRTHRHRYFGVLAPNSPLRAAVTAMACAPTPRATAQPQSSAQPAATGESADETRGSAPMGHVWEWVQDCWHGDYTGAPTDGSAWTTGCSGSYRVLRSGSWGSFPAGLRSADRYRSTPDLRGNYVGGGLRLARTP